MAVFLSDESGQSVAFVLFIHRFNGRRGFTRAGFHLSRIYDVIMCPLSPRFMLRNELFSGRPFSEAPASGFGGWKVVCVCSFGFRDGF